MSVSVAIVGGGIGGLTAALALLRKDVDVTVYERVSDLREIGAGLHLGPNGAAALFGLGLKERLMDVGVISTKREMRLWNTGEAWLLPSHGADSEKRFGAPYMLMHRGDLHQMLLDAVRALNSDAIRTGSKAVGLRQDGGRVELDLADGRTVEADALVGADGVHSAVRDSLGKTVAPQFSGNMFWRGMVPIDLVPERERDVTGGWFSPNGTVTVYPVRRGELLNFVGTVRRDSWDRLSWTEVGTTEECLADFEGWHSHILTIIRNMGAPYKWGQFQFETVKQWTKGRVTLLGDACHAMPPSLGQGAIMAIEDGVVLARCFAEHPTHVERALQRYQAARLERATRVVESSWQESRRRNNQILADPEKASAYLSQQFSGAKVSEFYDWIFSYRAHDVPI